MRTCPICDDAVTVITHRIGTTPANAADDPPTAVQIDCCRACASAARRELREANLTAAVARAVGEARG